MKTLLILTIGFCLLLTSVPAMADQAADEAAMRKLREQDDAAFNKHDAKAMANHNTENYVSWDGIGEGRQAFEKRMVEFFESQKDVQGKELELIDITFLTPNVAIYMARSEQSNLLDADGKPLPPNKTLVAIVFVKKNGKWLFAADFDKEIEE